MVKNHMAYGSTVRRYMRCTSVRLERVYYTYMIYVWYRRLVVRYILWTVIHHDGMYVYICILYRYVYIIYIHA